MIVPSKQNAYVDFGSKKLMKYQYEVLCIKNFAWIASGNECIPSGAIVGGETGKGERLYFGRVKMTNFFVPGTVHASHQCLIIFPGESMMPFNNYEILVEHPQK